MELLRSRWNVRGAKHRIPNKDGVVIYHCYDEQKNYSWWDDFGFFINGIYHVVWWVHPRMRYLDKCEDLAHDEVQHLYPKSELASDWLSMDDPIWKKQGKSRKKVVGYKSSLNDSGSQRKLWYDEFNKASERYKTTSDIVVHPSIKTEWLNYGKGIDLCYPVELRNEQEITEFALKLKESIKTGVPLEMTGTYSKDDFLEEKSKWETTK
jgi:hypothetical protein